MNQISDFPYSKVVEKIPVGSDPFSTLALNETPLSKKKLCYSDVARGAWLYQANCLEWMDGRAQ